MSKRRVGLGFELLYPPNSFPIRAPELSELATTGTLNRLVEYAGLFDVSVYSLRPAPGRKAFIRGWLMTQMQLHFERAAVSDPDEMAAEMTRLIDVSFRRPADADLVIETGSAAELPTLEQLETAFRKIDRFWLSDDSAAPRPAPPAEERERHGQEEVLACGTEARPRGKAPPDDG